jgi:hypothetical protein
MSLPVTVASNCSAHTMWRDSLVWLYLMKCRLGALTLNRELRRI